MLGILLRATTQLDLQRQVESLGAELVEARAARRDLDLQLSHCRSDAALTLRTLGEFRAREHAYRAALRAANLNPDLPPGDSG